MENKITFCDYNSVLVVNPSGKLRQVFTPFQVRAIHKAGTYQNLIYTVEEVRTTKEDQLVYIINEIPYYHYLFKLEIQF